MIKYTHINQWVFNMNDTMAVFFNNIAELEYDRNTPLPSHQEIYLNKMDEKMDKGIQIGAEDIKNPTMSQRAQYISSNLAHAIMNNEESLCAAFCSYLATRVTELKQVKINNHKGEIAIEFIYDQEYKTQVAVTLN